MPDHGITKEQTPVSREEFRDALRLAWEQLFHVTPSVSTCAILWGQFCLECGRDGKYCWNYNLGNVRWVPGWGHDYQELAQAWEIVDGKRVVTGGKFCAYHSLEEGMREYLAFLAALPRYSNALAVLRGPRPDAVGFVHELKAHGYFTGDERSYATAVWSIARDYEREEGEPVTDPQTPLSLASAQPILPPPAPEHQDTYPENSPPDFDEDSEAARAVEEANHGQRCR